jgi:hypothetical protein
MGIKEMAQRVRLEHWSGVMQARNASGQSVRRWCMENGISEKTYYYWQRKLREAICERMEEYGVAKQAGVDKPGFAEVKLIEPPIQKESSVQGELRIEIGAIKLSASSDYPPEQVAEIIRLLVRSADCAPMSVADPSSTLSVRPGQPERSPCAC